MGEAMSELSEEGKLKKYQDLLFHICYRLKSGSPNLPPHGFQLLKATRCRAASRPIPQMSSKIRKQLDDKGFVIVISFKSKTYQLGRRTLKRAMAYTFKRSE